MRTDKSSFLSQGDTGRERGEPKRIFGEWSLSAHVVQKSSYTSKFQLGGVGWGVGGGLLPCASPVLLRRKYKVHELGFVTVATGLFRHHYDSQNTNTHTHTQPYEAPTPTPTPSPHLPPAKTISSDNSGTLDATSVFSEQCYN